MKKLLATLLVAMMIMSCMSVVSFAAASTVYTLDTYDFSADARLYDDLFMEYSVTDKFTNQVVITDMMAYRTSGDYTPTTNMLDLYKYYKGTLNDFPTTSYGPGELIALPIYADGDGIMTYTIELDFPEELEYIGSKTAAGSGMGDPVLGDDGFTLGATASKNISGLLGINYYVVKSDAKTGNPDRSLSLELSFKVKVARGSGAVDATIGDTSMTVNLTGLTYDPSLGGGEEDKALDDDAAAEITANGTTVGIMSGADWSTFSAGYDVEGGAPSEEQSFICVFGTIPEGYTAEEGTFGFKFTTAFGKVTEGYASKIVDGKFGVVFYGADYALEGGSVEFFYDK